ncbi:sensor histidine kinase KdpD [Streptacidiphilus sp. PB12-B1b]|uniref:sensor histidine kinase n=1 Tax=Streptacidiphilus sp. PB12-B1b TaxID=2705012 RepID=UPI001CDCD006|nr:HAMP domain-containing sensor histidine kinase [Streptacidiphilus sp. PB12-B1b]
MTRSPARASLNRLRLRLTVAYTLLTAVGLAVLSTVAVRTDARSWRDVEFDEMRRRAAVAESLIYYDDGGRIQLDGLYGDAATTGSPQVTVLLQQPMDTLGEVFASRQPAFPVSVARLSVAARSAMAEDDTVTSTAPDDTGRAVYYLATPFYQDDTQTVAGAVVVVGDPQRGAGSYHELIAALVVGCAALTTLSAATGHVLSGRSMRPAWSALEQQERLLADAAHELRTPVAVMRGAVEVAELEPSSLTEHLPRIRRASERMSDVIENLLARGRLQAGADAPQRGPLRLDQLVEAVCAELPPGGHRLRLDLRESVVSADAGLVRLAVRNLLDNALRHGAMPGEGADVTVMVRGAQVSVADRGPGIAPDDLATIFTRFHSLGGSSGIGLSLVHWVATAHGGNVEVRARAGGGVLFTLRLSRSGARGRGQRRRPRM